MRDAVVDFRLLCLIADKDMHIVGVKILLCPHLRSRIIPTDIITFSIKEYLAFIELYGSYDFSCFSEVHIDILNKPAINFACKDYIATPVWVYGTDRVDCFTLSFSSNVFHANRVFFKYNNSLIDIKDNFVYERHSFSDIYNLHSDLHKIYSDSIFDILILNKHRFASDMLCTCNTLPVKI